MDYVIVDTSPTKSKCTHSEKQGKLVSNEGMMAMNVRLRVTQRMEAEDLFNASTVQMIGLPELGLFFSYS